MGVRLKLVGGGVVYMNTADANGVRVESEQVVEVTTAQFRAMSDSLKAKFEVINEDDFIGGESSETYSGTDSYQSVAADLELGEDAGAGEGDSAFLAPFMGNVLGEGLTQSNNYVAGVIGAWSVVGSSSVLPKAAVLGVVMDGATGADGAVVAHLDGSDPSSETRAGAAFKSMRANTNADSGYDYGLDLFHEGSDVLTDSPLPVVYDKADIRMQHEVCVVLVDGVPVDYTDGTPPGTGEGYAGKGSLAIDYTNGKAYINTGTKAEPAWTVLGTQS